MSSWGLEVHNVSGDATISTIRPQFKVYEEGDFTATGVGTQIGVEYIEFSSSTTKVPLVALNFPEDSGEEMFAGVKSIVMSGSDFIGFNLAYMSAPSGSHQPVNWRVYTPMENSDAVSGSYGLNLYGADGNLTWSSSANMMRIVATDYDVGSSGIWGWKQPCVNSWSNYFVIRGTEYKCRYGVNQASVMTISSHGTDSKYVWTATYMTDDDASLAGLTGELWSWQSYRNVWELSTVH
jgi:hypothetical protein